MIAIAAGIAVLTPGRRAGYGHCGRKAVEAIGRQLEASGKISSTLLLALAIIESTAIYGFVIALILIFTKA